MPRCPNRRPFGPHASDATRASHRQYVRAFSNSEDFALTGLVVTQQVGENPWHFCPSPQFVVTLEGSWYIRTSDGKTTTFKPGDVRLSASIRHAIGARCAESRAVDALSDGRPAPRHRRAHADAAAARRSYIRTTPQSTPSQNSERAAKPRAARSTGAARTAGPATNSSSA